jgi:hypothetical protein
MKTVISDTIEIHKKLPGELERLSPDIICKTALFIADAFASGNACICAARQ